MPINPKTKFREPSGLTGDWTCQHATRFWHPDTPLTTKFAIEKMCATLLARDQTSPIHPSFICHNAGPLGKNQITLRLEATFPTRRLYSLTLSFNAPRNWYHEDEFLSESLRVFTYWSSKLQIPIEEIDWQQASPALLAQDRNDTLAAEAAAKLQIEDTSPIATIQQTILDAIRNGQYLRSSHKEGSNTFTFSGHNFIRRDEGECPDLITFSTEDEFLKAIRNFHDWEARRHTYPHSPPELEVWKFIQSKLMS